MSLRLPQYKSRFIFRLNTEMAPPSAIMHAQMLNTETTHIHTTHAYTYEESYDRRNKSNIGQGSRLRNFRFRKILYKNHQKFSFICCAKQWNSIGTRFVGRTSLTRPFFDWKNSPQEFHSNPCSVSVNPIDGSCAMYNVRVLWYTLTQQQQQQQRHRICLSHRLCMYICDVCSSVDFDSCMVARGHIDIFVLLTSFLSVHLCSWLSSFDSVIILYNLCAVHIRTWYDFDRLNKKKIAILAPLTQWYRKTVQQLGPSIHIQNFIVCSQLTAQAVSSTASSTVSNSNSYIQPKVELKKFSCVKSEWKSVSVVRRAQK